jgi:hypothetical protein
MSNFCLDGDTLGLVGTKLDSSKSQSRQSHVVSFLTPGHPNYAPKPQPCPKALAKLSDICRELSYANLTEHSSFYIASPCIKCAVDELIVRDRQSQKLCRGNTYFVRGLP